MFNKDFFWELFLNTGRVDAYLLLKGENNENKNSIINEKNVKKG